MKIKAFFIYILLFSCALQAQNMVSMSSVHPAADTTSAGKRELAIRYPALRQFGVSASSFGYSDFDSKLDDQDFANGKIKTERITTFFNSPAIQWSGNSLSATVFYTYTAIELKDITNLTDSQLMPLTSDRNTIDVAVNYSRSDRIFNHPIIYSLVARGISDNLNSVKRFNFNGSFTLPIKKTENSSFSVGLLVLIDPSSPIPVEPIINYYHKFLSSGLELIVDIPTGINLKKEVARNAWVILGSNQSSFSTFYNRRNNLLDGKVSYNTIELKSGAAFEYLFAKNIMLSVGGGINNYFSSRLFKDGEHYSNASFTSDNTSAGYVNAGISLLSF
ncbi:MULTISPECIES: hypothetical protein [Flavobacterium]|uniref:hypothetical protein n=1 Tax=Flavobacterium TaxID=237 RepID=UPI002113AE1E|nr:MULTISPECIES: hypothetical protein [Flavobacterium]UUF14662.1 hypothetical protein NLJ00_00835 [Flavobacterium panici]